MLIAGLVLVGLIAAGVGGFLLYDKIQETLYVRARMAELNLKPEPVAPPKPKPLTDERFQEDLLAAYQSSGAPRLHPPYLQKVIRAYGWMYKNKRPSEEKYAEYLHICADSLISFARAAPALLLEDTRPRSTFYQVRNVQAELLGDSTWRNYDFAQASGAYDAYTSVVRPLKRSDAKPLFNTQRDNIGPNPRPFLTGQESDKDTEKAYEAAYDDEYDHMPYLKSLFIFSPLYKHAQFFSPDFDVHTPLEISDDARFFGQWVIGEPGAGKTTLLSTMINEDLKKVARNEASLFVMDSQNELVPDIAKLALFAPGGPLHGKLIYLEPHPDFPLALNVFDINKKRASSLSSSEERMMYEAGVHWMVDFFLKSLVKSDETSAQETFLAYVIPAVLAIPNATISTLQELLEPAPKNSPPPGYVKYKEHFRSLRPRAQKWLKDDMHSDRLKVTRDAIRSRLDGLDARGFFADMFTHPKNKFDLFSELQSGKVILINTKGALLKKTLEPFGRYFIARLLQAAEERMFTERGSRLPVYAYIDEADQYIAEEENIEELINKARKQKVGLIIANQMESHIRLPIVREALGRMAIQCRGEPPMKKGDAPTWHIQLGKQEPVRFSFPDTQFSKMPRMSERDFQTMLRDMRARYCTAIGEEEPEQEPPRQESPRQEPPKQEPPKQPSEEYDDRYDMLEQITLHPLKARNGTVITVKLPTGRTHQENIPPGTKSGYRFCVKGASRVRRPDNRNGNFWVELEIAAMPGDDTDAKTW